MLPMQTKMTFIPGTGGGRTRAAMVTPGSLSSKEPRHPFVSWAMGFRFQSLHHVEGPKSAVECVRDS